MTAPSTSLLLLNCLTLKWFVFQSSGKERRQYWLQPM